MKPKRETEEPKVKIAGQPIPCWLTGTIIKPESTSFFSEHNQDVFNYGELVDEDGINLEEELKDIMEKISSGQDPDLSSLPPYCSFSDINLSKEDYLEAIECAKEENENDIEGVVWVRCQIPTGAKYAKLPGGMFISDQLCIIGELESTPIPHIEDDEEGEDIKEDEIREIKPENQTEKSIPLLNNMVFTIPDGWKIGNIDQKGDKLIVPIIPIEEPANFDEVTIEMEKIYGGTYIGDSQYGRQEDDKVDALQQLIRTAAYLNYRYPEKDGLECTIVLMEDDETLEIAFSSGVQIIGFNSQKAAEKAIQILGKSTIIDALKKLKFTGE